MMLEALDGLNVGVAASFQAISRYWVPASAMKLWDICKPRLAFLGMIYHADILYMVLARQKKLAYPTFVYSNILIYCLHKH